MPVLGGGSDMLLAVFAIAIAVEVYQVVAHAHCLAGRTLPQSHRSTLGFAVAILGDALAYLLSCYCLYTAGVGWELMLFPMFAHVFYWVLLVFLRTLYLRIHDYRMQSIYTDGSFRRSKSVAAGLDTSFHLLAVVLIGRALPAPAVLCAAAVGGAGYLMVFRPTLVEGLLRRVRSTARPAPV